MRLIDADALKEEISGEWFVEPNATIFNYVFNMIDNAPTVELTELCKSCQYLKDCETCEEKLRPQGEWEYVQYDANPNIGNWHCSECRLIVSGKYNQKPGYNFCPRCGAQMRGDL